MRRIFRGVTKLSLLAIAFALMCYVHLVQIVSALAIQTQVNEVSDLFDRHIEDKKELLQDLKQQNDNAIEQIKSKSHHDAIEGIGNAEKTSNELSRVADKDLDSRGKAARSSEGYRFYDENELEPDYTKAGNSMHKADANDIVRATEQGIRKLGPDLTSRLKTFGIDCKTVKGPIQKDPTYYIEIKREAQKNTEYDQFLCEELRNQYNCNDSLALKCVGQGTQWVSSGEVMEAEFALQSAFNNLWVDWEADGQTRRVKQDAITHQKMKAKIAERLNINMEQIGEIAGVEMKIDTSERHILGNYAKYITPRNYMKIRYYKNVGKPICTEWAENWAEVCRLK